MKVRCCECDGKREPYRPVMKLPDGEIVYACKSCWRAFEYDTFMWDPMTGEDRQLMVKFRR